MSEHQLRYTWEKPFIVATCSCGRWQTQILWVHEPASEINQRLEEEHAKHVQEECPPT